MLTPLHQWICDVCGQVIETPEEGYVVWRNDENYRECDFKIIHQGRCDLKGYGSSLPVTDFLGDRGLALLLSSLSIGPLKRRLGDESETRIKDLNEYVDFTRRVQTPYYEEARQYFGHEDVLDAYSDANEMMPYLPDYLVVGQFEQADRSSRATSSSIFQT